VGDDLHAGRELIRMKVHDSVLAFVAVYGLLTGATSCAGSGGASLPSRIVNNDAREASRQYVQIERLGRPAVKEATQSFGDHDSTNRSAPWAEPFSSQTLYQAIGTFVTNVAGRRADYASTIQAILIPDEIAADLSVNATSAAYLGVETNGATGSAFGGRALSDDVIDADLGVLFGNTLPKLGLVSDDGKESPCLTTDNVGFNAAAKHVTNVFPYVGTPN
jgi:hypothetical protein